VTNRHVVSAARAGFITSLDAELVGRASVALGAGRDRVEDPVDPAVGIMVLAKPGEAVKAGDPVLELHYRDRTRLDAALALVGSGGAGGAGSPASRPLLVGEVH